MVQPDLPEITIRKKEVKCVAVINLAASNMLSVCFIS